MNHLVRLLVLLAVPSLAAQSLKNEDLGVVVVNKTGLFAAQVADFSKMDLANTRAVNLGSHGEIEEWQALKRGKGTTVYTSRSGVYEGMTEARFKWRRALDNEHWLALYGWTWASGSSNSSLLAQVMEPRGEKVFITQQIEANAHGAGADVAFDPATKLLTVKAVGFTPSDAHCCPSFLGVVTFRWDGQRFVRVGAKRVPIPKQD